MSLENKYIHGGEKGAKREKNRAGTTMTVMMDGLIRPLFHPLLHPLILAGYALAMLALTTATLWRR
jgi:hypothetical protein